MLKDGKLKWATKLGGIAEQPHLFLLCKAVLPVRSSAKLLQSRSFPREPRGTSPRPSRGCPDTPAPVSLEEADVPMSSVCLSLPCALCLWHKLAGLICALPQIQFVF